jgi:hypothetical protein
MWKRILAFIPFKKVVVVITDGPLLQISWRFPMHWRLLLFVTATILLLLLLVGLDTLGMRT